MRDLRLVGVHDDGEHLVVADDQGERYRLRIDEPLRAAARRDRPRLGQLQIEIDNGVRPREVQAMIRAGATTEEVAARTGWTEAKIARFEGPVLAEREFVAMRAQQVRLRGRSATGQPETLARRTQSRLEGRGVAPDEVTWDSARDSDGQWTVSARFSAGGRERLATWWFDTAGMTVVPKNDEARWLAEEDAPAGPLPTPHQAHRPPTVFDIEAEERGTHPSTDELMASMREHSGARGRRRGARRRATKAAAPALVDEALPLEAAAPGAMPDGTDEADVASTEPETPTPSAASAPPEEHAPAAPAAPGVEDAVADAGPASLESPPDEPAGGLPPSARGLHPLDRQHDAETGTDPQAAHDPETEATEPDEAEAEADEAEADEADEAEADEADQPAGKAEVDQPGTDGPVTEPEPSAGPEAPSAESAPQPGPATAKKRKGRASVPSWDDVMFGAKRGE